MQESEEPEEVAMPEEAPEEAPEDAPEELPREPPMPEAAMPPQARRDPNTVYVGKKSTMGYVLAVVTQFNNGASEVSVKARGKLISRAVDVVEIVRHRFLPNSKVSDIQISTEELTSEDGSRNKVSSIEIKLQK
jgi:DNA-binding protein